MADHSSEVTDTDSSWLGPPPGYDEVSGGCTYLSHPETDCWSEADIRTSESGIAMLSATVDGLFDFPAITY